MWKKIKYNCTIQGAVFLFSIFPPKILFLDYVYVMRRRRRRVMRGDVMRRDKDDRKRLRVAFVYIVVLSLFSLGLFVCVCVLKSW